MTDFNDLVGAIAGAAPSQNLRFRQGTIVSVNTTTATVKIGGSSTQVSGVHYASHVCPVPGATCWLATDGRDMFIIATLAPSGPAYGFMRKSAAQTIATATWVDMTWASRTDEKNVGTTNGTDGITVNVPGLYTVTVGVQIGGTLTAGVCYARITKTTGATQTVIAAGSGMKFPDTSTYALRATASVTYKLAAGDTVNGQIWQSTGANKDQDIGAGANYMSAVWVGPIT